MLTIALDAPATQVIVISGTPPAYNTRSTLGTL